MYNNSSNTKTDPGWQDSWNESLSQIDEKLIELYQGASETVEDLAESAKSKIHELLSKTDKDEKARANWDKAKADSKLFGAKVENRVQHLIADGKITLARLTEKSDGA